MRKVVSFIISVVLLFSGIPASFAGQTVIYRDGDIKPASVSFENKDSLNSIKVYDGASGSGINTATSNAGVSVALTDDRAEGNYAAKVTVGSSTNSNKNFITNLLDLKSAGLTTSNFSKITLSVKPTKGAKSIIFYADYISSGGTWTGSPTAVSVTYTVGTNLSSGKWNTVSLDLSSLGIGHTFNTIQAVVNEKSTWEFDDIQLKRQQAGTLTLSGTQDVTSSGSLNTAESARILCYTSNDSDLADGRITGLNIDAGRNAASTTDSSVQLLSSVGGINAKKVGSSIDGNTIYYVNNDGSKDVVYKYNRSAGTSTPLNDFTDALKTYWSISDAMKACLAPYNTTVDGISVSPDGNITAILKKGVRVPFDTSSGAVIKADVIVFNDGKSFYRSGTQSTFASTGAIEVKSAYWGIDSCSFISNSQLVLKEKYYLLNGGTYQATGAVRYKSITLSGDTYNVAEINEATYLNLLSRQSLSSNDQYYVYKVEADKDTNSYVVNRYGDDRTIGISGNKVTVSYMDTTGTYQTSTAVTLKSQIVGMSPINTDKNFVIVKTKPNTTTTVTDTSAGKTSSTGGSITNSTSTSSGITTSSAISTTTATGGSIVNTTTGAISSSTSSTGNLISNGFENGSIGWTPVVVTGFSVQNGIASFTPLSTYGRIETTPRITTLGGHKYYSKARVKTTDSNVVCGILYYVNAGNGTTFHTGSGNWEELSSYGWTYSDFVGNAFGVMSQKSSGFVPIEVDSIIVVDLTAVYGSGNEPSKDWCDANIKYDFLQNYTNGTATTNSAVTSQIQNTSGNVNSSSSTTQSDQQKNNSNTTIFNSLIQSGSENEWRSTDTTSNTTSTSTVTKYGWYAIDINKGILISRRWA